MLHLHASLLSVVEDNISLMFFRQLNENYFSVVKIYR